MWEGEAKIYIYIYGSKKYNRIASVADHWHGEPIIAGARVGTGEIINPEP